MSAEDKIKALRAGFPAAERGAFFDIAYDNGGSIWAVKAVEEYIASLHEYWPDQIKAGGSGRGKSAERVHAVRKLASDFLGADSPDRIAFTKNTNEAISNVLLGAGLGPGDNVITSDIEHPSVLMPCLGVKERGAECRVARTDGLSVTPEQLIELADENTRFIAVSHVQSRNGYKIDLKRLCDMAHETGICVLVDAIQSLGFGAFNARELGCDMVSAAGYKGLLAIDGIGLMYITRELCEKIKPTYLAANAGCSVDYESMSVRFSRGDAACKFENSSMNIAGIYALGAGLGALMDIGTENIEKHIEGLFLKLYDGLEALGFELATPRSRDHSRHSVSVIFPDPQKAYRFFLERDIRLSLSAGKYVRASIAPFTLERDVDRLLEVAAEFKG